MIPIAAIVCDVRVYPRISRLDDTTRQYISAMKRGDKFPPIVVTRINNVIYLVDGYHRLSAALRCGYGEIECQEIKCASLVDAYVEGVKRNATHGAPFEQAERVLIASNLRYLGYANSEISEILRMDPADVERNVLKTIERNGPAVITRRIELVPAQKELSFSPTNGSRPHGNGNHRMMPVYDYSPTMVGVLAEACHKLWVENMTTFAKRYRIPQEAVDQLRKKTVPYSQLGTQDQERYEDWARRTLARMEFSS